MYIIHRGTGGKSALANHWLTSAVGASTILYCTSDGGRHWIPCRVFAPVTSAERINVDNSFKRILVLILHRGWVLSEGGWLFQTQRWRLGFLARGHARYAINWAQ